MQIEKIKLSLDEQNQIFNNLIEKFRLINSNVYDIGESINFNLNELIEIDAFLKLYSDYSDSDENNQSFLISQSVARFNMEFYHEGTEIETNCNVYDKINKYYRK